MVIGETMDRVIGASRYFDAHRYRPWKDNFDAVTGYSNIINVPWP